MIATRAFRSVAALGAVGLVLAACAPPPAPPAPATIVVTTTADVLDSTDGLTSLREAFLQASNNNADTTVVVSSGAEYQLTLCGQGQLSHGGTRSLVVTTDGTARATVRQTCSLARVMIVGGSSVTLEHLIITGGRVMSPTPCGITIYGQPNCVRGAGIDAFTAITLRDVEVTDNRAIGAGTVEGGGLSARYGATITDSQFSSNASIGAGGAVSSEGSVTVTGSTFTSNSGGAGGALSVVRGSVTIDDTLFESNNSGSGGAIVLQGGPLSATDSVFRLNSSGGGPGAAIWADVAVSSLVLERVSMVQNTGRTGALTAFAGIPDFRIIDSTITDNTATYPFRDQYNRAAGGIATLGTSNITITGSTIAYNTATVGGGANIDLPPSNGTTVTVSSSIISDPLTSGVNCEANGNTFVVTDSLVSDATCGTPAALAGPALGPLTQSAGTWFRAPGPTSPAIDALAAPCSTPSDQRSVLRPQGVACDIGSIEN